MTIYEDSAVEWAHAHPTTMSVSFGRLETVAFQRHPEIFRSFGVDGATEAKSSAGTAPAGVRRAGSWITVVLVLLAALAPVAAIAVLGGDRFDFWRIGAERSVPIAGVLYGIGAVAQVAAVGFWLSQRARWEPVLAGIFVVALIFSGFGLLSVPNTAQTDGFSGWQGWYAPVAASVAVSFLATIAIFARFRARYEPPAASEPGGLDEVRVTISQLPASERDAIRADRDGALELLHSRGQIDDATFRDAVASDLGALYLLDHKTKKVRR